MTERAKQKTQNLVRVWLPLAISLGVNLYLVGFKLGAVEERMRGAERHAEDRDKHMPLSEKTRIFVPRNEWLQQQAGRDDQVREIRAILVRQSEKLDAIYRAAAQPN